MSDKITMRVAQYPDMDRIAEMIRSTAHWYESIVESGEYPKHSPDEAWKTRNFQLRDFYVAETPSGPVVPIGLKAVHRELVWRAIPDKTVPSLLPHFIKPKEINPLHLNSILD